MTKRDTLTLKLVDWHYTRVKRVLLAEILVILDHGQVQIQYLSWHPTQPRSSIVRSWLYSIFRISFSDNFHKRKYLLPIFT